MDNAKIPEGQSIPQSRLEGLYVYLNQLKEQEINRTLDIVFWQKRILATIDQKQRDELVGTLKEYQEEQKDIEAQVQIVLTLIEEEKAVLSKQEVTEILAKVKIEDPKEMIKRAIAIFRLSVIPYEVKHKFWQDRLAEITSPEVKKEIIAKQLVPFKQSIDLKIAAQKSAESYLETFGQKQNTQVIN